MKVAVLGATGPSGLEVVKRCLEKNFTVTAVVRSPDKFPEDIKNNPNFKAVKADIFDAASLTEHYKGQDGVLSCLGVPGMTLPFTTVTLYLNSIKATVEAMKRAEVKRFIGMTSWATEYHPDTSKWIEWLFKPLVIGRQLADMARMEHYLAENGEDIEFTTVRPAGLANKPVTDKNITAIVDAQQVPGGHFEIARADVARFMVDTCLIEGKYKRNCVAIAV